MQLTNADIVELADFRHELHRHPEVSGQEAETARRVAAFLAPTKPDRILTGLGGHGVAAVYTSAEPGPTVLIRSELDALPIHELTEIAHRSETPGVGHMCGHDGHSTILMGVARALSRQRPARGRVILMFQPAEEDGSGAAAVIADPRFDEIAPDWAFSLHNYPGVPLGQVWLDDGPANCASRGIKITLGGKTAHASTPEDGVSPANAIATLIPGLLALAPQNTMGPGFRLVTPTHLTMGEPAFGISPAHAELWATLRALTDPDMEALVAEAEALAAQTAADNGLTIAISYHDIFLGCINNADATGHLRQALDDLSISHSPGQLPMRGSEDFGRFGHAAKSAMFLLGSGEKSAKLHNPDYDFPDALIPIGTRIFVQTIHNLLG